MPAPSVLDDSLYLLRDHLPVLLSSAASIVACTWLAARAFYLQQVTAAKEHRDYVEAQLKDTKERLKELAPQSKATDLAGLLDELTRKSTVIGRAGEPLMSNRLVHLTQNSEGQSVVLLADKIKQFEAHGFVTRAYDMGDEVQVERFGQFPLSSTPTRRMLFLQTRGEASDNVDIIPDSIHQIVGTVGPGNVCLFAPAPQVLIA